MISLKCLHCNDELLPEAKFCRRCGAVVTASGPASNSSELPTAVFDQRPEPNTNALNPRVTSPETPSRAVTPAAVSTVNAPTEKSKRRRRMVLIGGAGLLFALCLIVAVVAYVRVTSHSQTTDDAALIYPGSRTIVDFASDDARSIHLQTDDSLERVIAWYEKSLKPTKTMRLTSSSVVLKNENVTTTLASESGKTNILIKREK